MDKQVDLWADMLAEGLFLLLSGSGALACCYFLLN